ncbi:MAG: hypothetical protein ACM3S2_02075 [Ignavibacteriales bacterium]
MDLTLISNPSLLGRWIGKKRLLQYEMNQITPVQDESDHYIYPGLQPGIDKNGDNMDLILISSPGLPGRGLAEVTPNPSLFFLTGDFSPPGVEAVLGYLLKINGNIIK